MEMRKKILFLIFIFVAQTINQLGAAAAKKPIAAVLYKADNPLYEVRTASDIGNFREEGEWQLFYFLNNSFEELLEIGNEVSQLTGPSVHTIAKTEYVECSKILQLAYTIFLDSKFDRKRKNRFFIDFLQEATTDLDTLHDVLRMYLDILTHHGVELGYIETKVIEFIQGVNFVTDIVAEKILEQIQNLRNLPGNIKDLSELDYATNSSKKDLKNHIGLARCFLVFTEQALIQLKQLVQLIGEELYLSIHQGHLNAELTDLIKATQALAMDQKEQDPSSILKATVKDTKEKKGLARLMGKKHHRKKVAFPEHPATIIFRYTSA